jgi:hypothetical protein
MGDVVLASSGMTINAGGVFELPIKVDRPSVLRIRFEVDEGYDVDFSLKFLEDTPKATIQTVSAAPRRAAPSCAAPFRAMGMPCRAVQEVPIRTMTWSRAALRLRGQRASCARPRLVLLGHVGRAAASAAPSRVEASAGRGGW